MVTWLKKFLSACIRTAQGVATGLECDLCVFSEDRYGKVKALEQHGAVRLQDTRPRLHVVLSVREGPPEGLARILRLLKPRLPGRIMGLDS